MSNIFQRCLTIAEMIDFYCTKEYEQYEVEINTNLVCSNQIKSVLEKLGIKCKFYTPFLKKKNYYPKERNVEFQNGSNLKLVYLISFCLKEFFGDSFDYYFNHGYVPDEYILGSTIGTTICKEMDVTGRSRKLKVHEILELDFKNLTWEKIETLFPIEVELWCEISEAFYFDELNAILKQQIEEIEETERYNNSHENKETYGRYTGSYAQDDMGYSDNFIDDVLEGDPINYWNID
jgi:hypothetical protein